jgi:hypothetical protein
MWLLAVGIGGAADGCGIHQAFSLIIGDERDFSSVALQVPGQEANEAGFASSEEASD